MAVFIQNSVYRRARQAVGLLFGITFLPFWAIADNPSFKSRLETLYHLEQQRWLQTATSVEDKSGIDVQFYHIDIDLQIDNPFISGSVLCRFTATNDSVKVLKLNLHHSLKIDRIEGPVRHYQFSLDTVYIHFLYPFMKQKAGQITLYYSGQPVRAGGIKGLVYETHNIDEPVIATLSTPFLSHYWWPCKDGPGDKADSVYIDITIPDRSVEGIPLVAVSNGTLDNVMSRDGKKTFQWRERYPIIPYYVMLAVSNYKHFQQKMNSPHSFPVDYYLFSENYSRSVQSMREFPHVMDFFIQIFGDYPFSREKYAMTELGFYGAIENQTNTIINNLSAGWFDVAVHELAHMWFGDMITCESWHHAWLNEGFAVYCEALWQECKNGRQGYINKMRQNEYLRGGTLYLQDVSDPFRVFIGIVYSKGAWFLHMLRGVLDDEIFFKCLKAYTGYDKIRYRHANTNDFLSVCESVSGLELDFFFQQWLYDEYFPIYFYSFSQDPSDFRITLTIRQQQERLGRRPVFIMPVQILLHFQDGSDSLVTVWNDRLDQSFEIFAAKPLTRILLDPNEWILKQVNRDAGVDMDAFTLSILQNFPNPFTQQTTLSYIVSAQDNVRLYIYDIQGRLVAKIVDKIQLPGTYQIMWTGRDQNGQDVAPGIYFAALGHDIYIKIIRL